MLDLINKLMFFLENRVERLYTGGIEELSVFLVIEGERNVTGENYCRQIKKGDYFFTPYSANGQFYLLTDTELKLTEIFASKDYSSLL